MAQDGQRWLGTEGDWDGLWGRAQGQSKTPLMPSMPSLSPCRYSLLAVFAATDGGITRVFPNK